MHEKSITFQDFLQAKDELNEAARKFGLEAAPTTEWVHGYLQWTCRYAPGFEAPAVYFARDLRDSTYTYWRDEPGARPQAGDERAPAPEAAPEQPPRPESRVERLAKSPHPGEPFTLLLDVERGTWKRGEWQGDELLSVQVTEYPAGTWRFELDCYYGPRQKFDVTITQPFVRAARTVVAALRADLAMEAEPGPRSTGACGIIPDHALYAVPVNEAYADKVPNAVLMYGSRAQCEAEYARRCEDGTHDGCALVVVGPGGRPVYASS